MENYQNSKNFDPRPFELPKILLSKIAVNNFVNLSGQRVLAGMKRGIILMIHFFLPEMVRITSLVAYGPAKYFRTIFWDSYMTRERVGNKRGDLIDSLMDLKNGEQNPDFGELATKIYTNYHLINRN